MILFILEKKITNSDRVAVNGVSRQSRVWFVMHDGTFNIILSIVSTQKLNKKLSGMIR